MKSLTVSELTQSIKNLIETEFSGTVSVSGEISGYSVSPSGHAYFVLKDERAKIKAVMFRNSIRNLGRYSPNNGDKVVVIGNIKLYEPEGNYQIVVKQIIYDTVGDFYKKFEETKRKLEQEGLFAKEKKKPVKSFIKRIAVITSPSGAAIKDFLITLKKNGISIEIDIYPSQVQGNTAIPFIIKSIIDANKFQSKYDLLILMRGGGSLEDLSVFNDEFIARALFDSKIPTISAIGHERDFTIADFVADIRVATPTAAAEFISNLNLTFINQIEEFLYLIENKMENKLNDYFQNLDLVILKIQSKSPGKKLNLLEEKINGNINKIKNQMIKILTEKKRLTDMELYKIDSQSPLIKFDFYKKNISSNIDKIKFFMKKKISDKIIQIENSEKIISNSLTIEKISYNKMLVCNLINEIKHKISDLLLSHKSKLELIESKINLINPENILDKGYAVVTKNNKLITDISNVKLDDELEIKLRNGYINSFVTGKRKK